MMNLKEAVIHGLLEVLKRNLLGGTEEYHEKPQFGIAGFPVEIQTECRSNTSQDRYSCVSPLGGMGGRGVINLAKDREQWRSLVSTAVNHCIP
jgi:hypothetical protein